MQLENYTIHFDEDAGIIAVLPLNGKNGVQIVFAPDTQIELDAALAALTSSEQNVFFRAEVEITQLPIENCKSND